MNVELKTATKPIRLSKSNVNTLQVISNLMNSAIKANQKSVYYFGILTEDVQKYILSSGAIVTTIIHGDFIDYKISW